MHAGLSGRASRLLWLCAPILIVLLWPSRADAYPWMLRHGYTACATCHTDPSGGELLNPYGRVQSDLILRMRYGADSVSAEASQDESSEESEAEGGDGLSDASGFLWGLVEPPEFLLLGGSIRTAAIYDVGEDGSVFPMQFDLYGQLKFGSVRAAGSIGLSRVEPGSPHAHAAQVTTNQGEQFNMISRSHWIGVDFTDEFLVRAGRLNLPFGVRMPEHVMWVREQTRTDRESDQQHGLALSYSGSSLRGELMAILGNYQINPDKFRERGYSLFVEMLVTSSVGFGVSSMVTTAEADLTTFADDKTLRQAHGLFTRLVPVSQVAVLLEADALLKTDLNAGYVGFLQVDYEPVQGLHFLATGEFLDQGFRPAEGALPDPERAPGFGEPKFGGWLSVDWFFAPHCEVRIDGIARQDDPFRLLAQFHVFL
jgi:hypothetical protein